MVDLLAEAEWAAASGIALLSPRVVETGSYAKCDHASAQDWLAAAAEIKAGARSKESERVRRARVHRNRHLRWHQDDEGGIRGEFSCDEVAWARIHPLPEGAAKARWKAAGSLGGEALDRLLHGRPHRLVGRGNGRWREGGSTSGPGPH